MKNSVELQAQHEIDEDIVYFVREMQVDAAVRSESIINFLKRVRQRRVTDKDVEKRLDYLVSKDFLASEKEWVPGEGDVEFYTATAKGSDALDGAIPWK